VTVATIGHNRPPAREAIAGRIEDLELEAGNWLDGEPIANAKQSEAVAALIAMARQLEKDADAERKAEAKPFDDGKAAVQAAWKPLIERVARIAAAAKEAQTAWLVQVERKQREEAARLAAEAAAAREAAQAAWRAANPASLAEREAAEAALKQAALADAAAERADRATATAKAGDARAIGLRTHKRPELVDLWDAAAHYFRARPEEFAAWVLDQAAKDIRAGVVNIPGIRIITERKAS
jgi:hypothetical protein